jgi:hypothetical protein
MYLTSEQTSRAELLIRLTSQGFIATASEPDNLSQDEPHEVVTIDYTMAVRAALEALQDGYEPAPQGWPIAYAPGSQETEPETAPGAELHFDIQSGDDETEEN